MGFGEWLDPRGRFCMLNRRNYTRNGHDWNPMPDMELGSLRGGGFVFLEVGLRKGEFGRTPPLRTPPPGYGPECDVLLIASNPNETVLVMLDSANVILFN